MCRRGGRLALVGASAELDVAAHDVVLPVQVLSGANRVRFDRNGELFAAWKSASYVKVDRRTGGQADSRGASGGAA